MTTVPCRHNCGRTVVLPSNIKIAEGGKILIPCRKCARREDYYNRKIKGK